jgi:uncharacterized protein (TIGR02246 family)
MMSGGPQPIAPGSEQAGVEAEIRALIDEQTRAICVKDVEASLANYAPDVVLFDVIDPLRRRGAEAARARLAAWFASFRGPIGYEVRDLVIGAGAEVAFCHGLKRVRATTTAGRQLDMWWRATICYRKVEGAWRVTHEHASVPFDAASGRASLDLAP